MATDDISGLFFGPVGAGSSQALMGGNMTAWDSVTRANTVTVGTVTYTNLPVLFPTMQAVGPVLLFSTPAGPFVLGPYAKP